MYCSSRNLKRSSSVSQCRIDKHATSGQSADLREQNTSGRLGRFALFQCQFPGCELSPMVDWRTVEFDLGKVFDSAVLRWFSIENSCGENSVFTLLPTFSVIPRTNVPRVYTWMCAFVPFVGGKNGGCIAFQFDGSAVCALYFL